jgi:protein O-mannosyl-transferase
MLRLRNDPGLAFVALALVLVAAVYAVTIGRGLINYEDPWLVADNWVIRSGSLGKIFGDFSREVRFVLGAEYLPIRDVSMVIDHRVWGDWYGGYHLTNVVLYEAAIVVWFISFCELGIDRKLAGLAMLIWAVHPAHAESVAWLSERKGLCAALFAGVALLGYARYRSGRHPGWLILAVVSAVFAVWSKAPAVFAIASLGALEVVLPDKRQTWRRSVAGLASIMAFAIAAMVPVMYVALDTSVISAGTAISEDITTAVGFHGFYLQLAAMVIPNSISYPIVTAGPTVAEIALGAVGLVAILVAVVRGPAVVRAAALLWLINWFPVSRLVFPLRNVLLADRYLLLPTLGFALVLAWAILRIERALLRRIVIAAILVSATIRAIDAQTNWRDARTLWQRAVTSNPHDGDAWSMYVESVMLAGDDYVAFDVMRAALQHSQSPRLLHRKAMFILQQGKRGDAVQVMRSAATAGDVRAMSNLALLLLEDGNVHEALLWARKATSEAPLYANAQRLHGKIALAARLPEEAYSAFSHTYRLEPHLVANRFNLALALIDLGRVPEARAHLQACITDPTLSARAKALLETTAPR